MKTYSIDLTFNEHRVLLRLVRDVLLESQDGVSDSIDPEDLPAFKNIFSRYSKAFAGTDMLDDL